MTVASVITIKDFFAAHCSVMVGFSQIFFLILSTSNFRLSKHASQQHLAIIANQSQASNLHMTTQSSATGQSLVTNLSFQLLHILPPRRSNCPRQSPTSTKQLGICNYEEGKQSKCHQQIRQSSMWRKSKLPKKKTKCGYEHPFTHSLQMTDPSY